MLVEMTLRKFIETLGSHSPTPGGGSVAALSGAVAFALVEMVARLTIGKKGYESANDEMTTIVTEAVKQRDELLADVDRDSAAFDQVTAAFKLPKESADDKSRRSAAIQEAYKKAAQLPLDVARRIVQGMPLINAVIKRGNKNARSDALSAALQAQAGLAGAIANVKINLDGIKDKEIVAQMTAEITRLETAFGNSLAG